MGDSKSGGGGGSASGEQQQMMAANQNAVMMSQQNMQAIQQQLQQGLDGMATSQASGQLLSGGQVLQQQLQSSMATTLTQPPIGSISLQGNVGQSNTTITTMATVPQQTSNQQPQQLQQVQVIQQPMPNYVQQLYNTHGHQMLMQMHPNMNQSIQVIAKPFQSNQVTSHVIGKPALVGNQQGSFPSYATIPTTNNQTLVIAGQLISGQLQNSAQAKQELQKSGGVKGNSGGSGGNNQQQVATLQGCVVSQPLLQQIISPIQYTTCTQSGRATVTTPAQPGPPVQLASPWQLNTAQLPIWASHHPQVIATQNPIFIRNQQEHPMFIQSPQPQQNIQQQQQPQQQQGVTSTGTNTQNAGKDNKGGQQINRTMSILPSVAQPIRPATSLPQQVLQKQQNKLRTKAIITKANPPPQKLDAQNQTKPLNTQQLVPGAKMIITQQGTIVQQDAVTGKMMTQHQTVAGMTQQGILMHPQMLQQQSLQGIPMSGIVVDQSLSESAKMTEQQALPAPQDSENSSPMAIDEPTPHPEAPMNGTKMEMDKEENSNTQVEEVPKEVKAGPPKAMVKPQVLTHIIEGYVIQESSEPFPINRNSLVSDLAQSAKTESAKSPMIMEPDEPPVKKQNLDMEGDGGKVKCQGCDKVDVADRFIGKYCSPVCAKRSSLLKKKDDGKPDKEWTDAELEAAESLLNDDPLPPGPISNPVKWTVSEVCDFIKNLPGCSDYAEDFAIQEIDGQALMLLKADHLMSAMSMKLGPALKICARIDTMRAAHEAQQGAPQPA